MSKASPEKCPSLLSEVREVPLSKYPLLVHSKVQKKPPLLRGEQSEPLKVPFSLSSEAREVSLSTYPLLVHTKVPKKQPLLRGKQSEP